MRSVRDIPEYKNVPILVRAALNVPVADGVVVDTFRLRQALPTIAYLQERGAKVILLGHVTGTGAESLKPMYEVLKKMLPAVEFSPTTIGKEVRALVRAMRPGDVLMLENLRRFKGEESNDLDFTASLAELADVFVQDAFDVCHRAHASVVGLPKLLPSYLGLLVEKEVEELSKALSPKHPALAIIAGAKFSTKEPVLHTLLSSYDQVFVGGALANDFLEAKGFFVADSLVSGGNETEMKKLAALPELLLPEDVYVAEKEAARSESKIVSVSDISDHTAILDVGPNSITSLLPYIKKAKTILWNGTLGRYEHGFTEGTRLLAEAITESNAHSILGGGDTVAALDALGLTKKFSFVSTGGGAMLDFLAEGTLPGLEALTN
ncbi:MAG: phosphoglycerate kinase [Patescibacteria group bacterium]